MEKKKSSDYPQFGIRLSKELIDKLQEEAKKQERSMSQVARFAIEAYLNK